MPLPYSEFVMTTFAPSSSDELDILHCAIGIASEFTELQLAMDDNDQENIIEEIGDMGYYLTVLSNLLKHDPEYQEDGDGDLLYSVDTFLNLIKKKIFYKQNINLAEAMNNLFTSLVNICPAYDTLFLSVISDNQDKLTLRYPSGFTTQASIDRADK